MMPFPAINAPNLVTDNLNPNNSDPILLQIPRNPQLPERALPSHPHIGNITVTKIYRWTNQDVCTNGYLYFIRPSAI
jgi:hypothetical protein